MSKSQRVSAKIIRRIKRACEIEEYSSVDELFDTAGKMAGIAPKEIKKAKDSYNAASDTHGKVDPPPWLRRHVNRVRKPLARAARHRRSIEQSLAQSQS